MRGSDGETPRGTRLRRGLLAAFAALVTACGDGSPPSAQPSAALGDAPLKQAFAPRFLVGAAIEPEQLENPADVALLETHFSSITAENVMKPRTIAPAAGSYDFAPADRLVQFAVERGIAVRGHTLLWHRTAPAWFFEGDRTDSAAYRALVRQRLETYVTDVVTHFRGRVYAWDVVNEVASDGDAELYRTDSPWHAALGPSYIEYAFRAARAADPDTLLFINDYNTEQPAKLARVLTIVADLRGKNVPIDGVGHQLHLQIDARASAVDEALAATASLGLVNHVTELDISLYADPSSCFSSTRTGCSADYGAEVPQAVLTAQAALYRELFAVFAKHGTLTSVTTWGIADDHTWLGAFPVARTNRPLLFDVEHRPKW